MKINLLKEAAYNYGLCSSQRDSAISCRASDRIFDAMDINLRDVERNLFLAAVNYFDDIYDGIKD